MNSLEDIRKILDSDAKLKIEDESQLEDKKVVDDRFSLIMQKIEMIEEKDNIFYIELIKLLGEYVELLYDREVEKTTDTIFTKNVATHDDLLDLKESNRKLSRELFQYACSILKNNKDITLNIETLKKLLNRKPKISTLFVYDNALYRTLNYGELAEIIANNNTLEKSNIDIKDIYQLLFDTYQINNNDVFCALVKPEQFRQNHQKIDEILSLCNVKTFVEITRIIKRKIDKNFDILNIVKKRNKDNFCELLIFELFRCHRCFNDDYNLVHQILTDPEIEVDYDFDFIDDCGERSDLKSILALSENKTIIKDILSRKQNIQNNYIGYSVIQLYTLYAIIGDYEKAIDNFENNYNFIYDLDDDDKNWDKYGYAYGGWGYVDSLARFIKSICSSLKEDNVDYSKIVSLIKRVINNKNVKYINIKETLPYIKDILSSSDFKLLIEALLEKHKSGNLEFISIIKQGGVLHECRINKTNEEEIKNQLNALMPDNKIKVLSINC